MKRPTEPYSIPDTDPEGHDDSFGIRMKDETTDDERLPEGAMTNGGAFRS
jgi:hypothetical protein